MMLATAVSDMQTIGDKTEGAGAPVDDGWKLWSKAVKAATSVPEAATHLLQLEEALCSLGADVRTVGKREHGGGWCGIAQLRGCEWVRMGLR